MIFSFLPIFVLVFVNENHTGTASHLRCHGNAADEEDDADGQRGEEADAFVEAEPRKLVNEPGDDGLNKHHLVSK